jgi:tetratricopeptide (TPR) repeat protein
MSGYEIARLSELESLPGPGSLRWTPIRKRYGITAFGINAYTANEAGQDVVEEHNEERLGHEELYVVVSGRATFVLDGEERDVPAGSFVYLRDPKLKRFARAEEPGTTVLAIGGKPGQHSISAWEYFFAAYPKADAGDYEGALAELDEGLAQKANHPPLQYHRACILVRMGRLDEAREWLDRALEGDPELKRWADEDEDLAPLRVSGEPEAGGTGA